MRTLKTAMLAPLLAACTPHLPPNAPEAPKSQMLTAPNSITVQDVVRMPRPGMSQPVGLAFTPDGSRVTYLDSADDSDVRQLYAWNPETGERGMVLEAPGGGIVEGELSLEEQLRRERARERGQGITRYSWSDEGELLLLPIAGAVWVQSGLDGEARRIAEGVQRPTLSPDGSTLAWVKEGRIWWSGTEEIAPRLLTSLEPPLGATHGLAEFVAQEEMGRSAGFWWSPNADAIAFTEVDESHIPVWRIPHEGKDEPTWEDHRYPFAGQENARVRLAVTPLDSDTPVWMDLTAEGTVDPHYVARVTWESAESLLVQVTDRNQQRLDLLRVNPQTGQSQVLLTETSDIWINLHKDLRVLKDRPGVLLWASERTGFKHLYQLSKDGQTTALTEGDWMVDRVVTVDEKRGLIYFMGTKDGATQSHLYRVPLDGGDVVRITEGDGHHQVIIDRTHQRFLDVHHSTTQAPTVTLHALDTGESIGVMHEPDDPRLNTLPLPPPELRTVRTRDGVELDAALYRPDTPGPWPLLVHVYGGPHATIVQDSWGLTVDMRDQWLRAHGFAILKVDNRGAARRGLTFEGAIRHNMGDLEVQDQADAVQQLIDEGLARPDRVGIFGWSYGGYMSAISLARAPETFHVAVAGAPVTHWDGYDTHYTERYMGTPQSNPDGYEISSVMAHVEHMTGDLMLVHGMIDENVHFRHTARLMNALIAADKDAELLAFPNERHLPRGEHDRIYMERRVRDFLVRHIGNTEGDGAQKEEEN